MPACGYRQLTVWNRAVDLAAEVYAIASLLPEAERYGLASQMRRAATSIPANIAEGYGRGRRAEFARYLSIANGSLKELETHLFVAGRIGAFGGERAKPALAIAEEIGRMLSGLRRSLEAQQRTAAGK